MSKQIELIGLIAAGVGALDKKSIDYTTIGIIAASAGLITLYFMKQNKSRGRTLAPKKKRTIESIEKRLKREYKRKYGKDSIVVDDSDNVQDKKNERAKDSGKPTENPIINSGKNSGATVGPRPKPLRANANTKIDGKANFGTEDVNLISG